MLQKYPQKATKKNAPKLSPLSWSGKTEETPLPESFSLHSSKYCFLNLLL